MNEAKPDRSEWVLIGDDSHVRFELFAEILQEDFHLQVEHATNFNEMKLKVEEAEPEWRLLLLAERLPPARGKPSSPPEQLSQ